MKEPVTQMHDFGCGAACVAFAANTSYNQAVTLLGVERAAHFGFYCKELVSALKILGLPYTFKKLQPQLQKRMYQEGTIVFVAEYPYGYGHYFVRHNGWWMDPWINLPFDRDVNNAISGFRKRLPGRPRYALFMNTA